MIKLLLRGDRLRAARFIPFAKKKVLQLRALKKSLGVHVLTKQLKVDGGRIHLTSDGAFDRIDILIRAGELLFSVGNLISKDPVTGAYDRIRYYFYKPENNSARFFLEIDMNDYPAIQALNDYRGLLYAEVFGKYATAYSDHLFPIMTQFGYVFSSRIPRTAVIRFKRASGGTWNETSIDLEENLQQPDEVTFTTTDGVVISLFSGRYREGKREYSYAFLLDSGTYKACLISRDVTVIDLDWAVDHVLGEWSYPNYPFRHWAFALSDKAPAYNSKYAYAYAETVRAAGRDYEIWEYDRAKKTKVLAKTWLNVEGNNYAHRIWTFLDDHSGHVCGYMADEASVDGSFDDLPNNYSTYDRHNFMLYSGPVNDIVDGDGLVLRAGGLANITLLASIDLAVEVGAVPNTSGNSYYYLAAFWRISNGFGVDESGNVIDNTVYGIWGVPYSTVNSSFLARYSVKDGFKLVHKSKSNSGEYDDITFPSARDKNIFITRSFYYNMKTDADPTTGLNGKVKDLNSGTIIKDGSPAPPSFLTSKWSDNYLVKATK